ncbi:hypothetical protein BDQ17DRAFT_1328553 [Cyathus striatus]|nr:hypothetical protein BDQ17DRAFT_1328553 [Cyathus striatus]
MKKQQIIVQSREREMVEREEVGKRGEEVGDKEDKAASDAANKDKSKVKWLFQLHHHTAQDCWCLWDETICASETTRISEITSTSEVLATTPSESSESENNNLEAEHGSGTENVSQDSNEEDEDKDGSDDVDINDNEDNEGGEEKEVEKGDEDNVAVVEAIDIDSALASEPVPTKLIIFFDTEYGIWIIFGQFNDIESTDTIKWTSRLNDMALYLAAISVRDLPRHGRVAEQHNPPDAKTTHELWGLEKTAGFTQVDLEHWIMGKKNISAGKGKQKAEGGKTKNGSDLKKKI